MWPELLVAHLVELNELREERAQVDGAILRIRADRATVGHKQRWEQDRDVLFHSADLREELLGLDTSIAAHEAAVATITLFIKAGVPYSESLIPPPILDSWPKSSSST